MVFSSLPFLFVFLPAVLALYFLIPQKFRAGRNSVLLIASLIFYGYGGPRLLPLILTSIAINYVFGLLVARVADSGRKRGLLALGIVLNLLLLGWFKYAGFFATNLVALGLGVPIPNIVLPIGISFYTFQGMSYLVDVYRGETAAQRSFLRLALYISLFTQLVAGPIVRYSTIAEALSDRRETFDDFADGSLRFVFGLAKKVLLANQLGQVADAAFAANTGELSVAFAWLGLLAYSGQIYFDFSGYSDMAIGLGRVFGFRFLENFNYPYMADSATDFWRRWHISLSSWFRDYLYIPLGGNRGSHAMQLRNLLIVWLLTGLWHGAAWNFIFWGLYFALFLIGERYLWRGLMERMPTALRHVYALLIVVFGWLLFRSAGLAQIAGYTAALFGGGAGLWSDQMTYYLRAFAPELILGIAASLPIKLWLQKALDARQEKPLARLVTAWGPPILALGLLALCVMRLVSGGFNPFIYFQF